jgi:hypothetical protein
MSSSIEDIKEHLGASVPAEKSHYLKSAQSGRNSRFAHQPSLAIPTRKDSTVKEPTIHRESSIHRNPSIQKDPTVQREPTVQRDQGSMSGDPAAESAAI